MRMHRAYSIAAAGCALALIVGCSGGHTSGRTEPTTPVTSALVESPVTSAPPTPAEIAALRKRVDTSTDAIDKGQAAIARIDLANAKTAEGTAP